MKKFGIEALAAALLVTLAVLGLTGCPNGDETTVEGPDKPLTPSGWTKGLESLKVETGNDAGTILYQFDATDPAADSYQLYRVKGINNKAGDIIAGDTAPLTPAAGSKTAITGLDNGETYSIVVVANKTGNTPAVSAVKQVKAMHVATKLTINNIPYQTIPFFFVSAEQQGTGAAVLGGFLDASLASATYTPQHSWDAIVPQAASPSTKADASLYLYDALKLMGYAQAAQNANTASTTAINLRPGNVDKKKLSGSGHLNISVYGSPGTDGGAPTSSKTYKTKQPIDFSAAAITVDWDTQIEDTTPPTP
jgi:hypothetical protein